MTDGKNTEKEDKARVGVFFCSCKGSLSEKIDLKSVMGFAEQQPNVTVVKGHDALCTKEGQAFLTSEIKESNIERVVIAACSPRKYEDTIRNALEPAGLNKYLYEQANLREQCAWVHKDKSRATEKAKCLVAMSIARAVNLEPLLEPEIEVTSNCLVIGGGVAGMRAALDLASHGFKTYLVEREENLGGRAAQLAETFPTSNCGICCIHNCIQCTLTPNIDDVFLHDNIEVMTSSEVVGVEGHIGNYKVKIRGNDGVRRVDVGAIIVATGSKTFDPSKMPEYGYDYEDVITSLDLERLIVSQRETGELRRPSDGRIPNTVNFIQCVGSRQEKEGNPHCSLVCCTFAIGQARAIKSRHPDTEVYIHYIDLRAPYKGFEEYYREAREMGINFIRGRVAKVEKVGDKLIIMAKDADLGKLIRFKSDLVVLSVGQEPSDGTENLSKMLYKELDLDGFYKHFNLEFASREETGVFIAGCAQGPKGIRYSVGEGKIAAAYAASILKEGKIKLNPIKSFVVDENCDGCAYCIDPCPYKAITLIEYIRDGAVKKTVQVNEGICRGCGICVATCPKKGIFVRHFKPEQVSAMVNSALATGVGGNAEPLIVAFCCNWCGYPAADLVGVLRMQYPANILTIRVRCSGMVHPNQVIDALTGGADGVLIVGCHKEEELKALGPSMYKACHYVDGNLKAEKRAEAIELMLDDFGIERERFRLEWVSASEGEKFARIAKEMVENLKALGPSAYKKAT